MKFRTLLWPPRYDPDCVSVCRVGRGVGKAGRSVLGNGILVLPEVKISTDYLNTNLLKILPDTCYRKLAEKILATSYRTKFLTPCPALLVL